jgi:hypothetical protein
MQPTEILAESATTGKEKPREGLGDEGLKAAKLPI